VDENVYAYSNRAGDERALVVYHNRFAEARGWVRTSVAYADLAAGGGLVQRTLGEGLGLHDEAEAYTLFRDHVTGLEYIRSSHELCERGLYVELGAYKYHVFLDVREVWDDASRHYGNVAAHLNGRGVPSVEEAARELEAWPVLEPFRRLANADTLRRLMPPAAPDDALLRRVGEDITHFLRAVRQRVGGEGEVDDVARAIVGRLRAALGIPEALAALPADLSPANAWAAGETRAALAAGAAAWGTLLGWALVHDLGRVSGDGEAEIRSRAWLDEWLLGKALAGALRELGVAEGEAWRAVERIRVLVAHPAWLRSGPLAPQEAVDTLAGWLQDEATQRFIGLHRFEEGLWFHQESFEELLRWMLLAASVEALARAERGERDVTAWMASRAALLHALRRAAEAAGYRLDRLLEA